MNRLFLTATAVILAIFASPVMRQPVLAQDTQQLVEDVEIRGNRAIPTDTIKLYIQSKRGDLYSENQLQRDFQAVMAQGFFDEFESRVVKEEGPRGGIVVIFYVKERPIIRDITYEGNKSVQESDIIQRFREKRVKVSKESRYDPVAVEFAKRVLSDLLAEKGKPNAQIDDQVEEISATTVAVNFVINEGRKVRISKISFDGNKVFSERKLRKAMKLTKQASLFTTFSSKDIYDKRKLDEDLQRVRLFMGEKGYIRPEIGEPELEPGKEKGSLIPFIGGKSDTIKVKIPIQEGERYTFGKINVEGNSLFTADQVLAVTGMKTGEIASAKVIREGVFERLRKFYGRAGYIQATTELNQNFNPTDNSVDFTINIEEGKQFVIRRIDFTGNTNTRDNVMRREILINEGDQYNQEIVDFSRLRLNQLGYFEEIKEEDFQLQTDERNGQVDVNVKVKEKGRQQISFTGGVSGVGGSFIGVTYSTNNLFGYGEALSLDVQAGNRQRNLSVSFTEPYLRGRPISAGIQVFTSKQKFFTGSLNTDLTNALNSGVNSPTTTSQLNDSLFSRTSTGFTVSLQAPSTYFIKNPKYVKYTRLTRLGLSYGFSATKVSDPTVNRDSNPNNDVFVSFSQPNVRTSTITPTLSYNSLNGSLDPTEGKSLSLSLSFSGLGGDVKLITPTLEFKYFKPTVRKEKPQVLGMRLLVEHSTSYGKPPATNTLSFVGGIPIFSRFFAGGEDTIRGYNVRSISPIAQIDTSYTSNNVQAIDLISNNPLPIQRPGRRFRGVDASVLKQFTFTNKLLGNSAIPDFRPVGGDSQIIYNLEYRIPLVGPLSMALFADAGTSFNIASLKDVLLVPNASKMIIPSDPNAIANNMFPQTTFVLNPKGLIATQREINQARTPETPITALPKGFRFVTFQGLVNQNQNIRLSQNVSGIGQNFRASIGSELRVQVPVVGVPFRLIFAYNPNAKTNRNDPRNIFLEQKTTVRFSIGRTF